MARLQLITVLRLYEGISRGARGLRNMKKRPDRFAAVRADAVIEGDRDAVLLRPPVSKAQTTVLSGGEDEHEREAAHVAHPALHRRLVHRCVHGKILP
jgi:hypothetical protein